MMCEGKRMDYPDIFRTLFTRSGILFREEEEKKKAKEEEREGRS